MEINNKIIKPFLTLTAIYTVSISALIRANYYYIDDLSRASSGMKGWDHFSRYISVWLSQIIHADSYLTDISPLPQLIAIVFLALAAIKTIIFQTSSDTICSPSWIQTSFRYLKTRCIIQSGVTERSSL